jgi:hypothetical protein
MVEYEEEQN